VRQGAESFFELSDGPVKLPRHWAKLVEEVIEPERFVALENSMRRGAPFGDLN
jgi:hypothetical protein